jgi:DNA-binding FadR family transcriptional regulator
VSHLIPGDGMPNLDVLTDVLEFRRWFGRELARQAAERAVPDDIKKLEGIAEQASDPQLDLNELLKLDFEFYVTMSHIGRNRVMQLLINTIRSAVLSYAPFFAQFNPPAVAVRKHHRDLIKAIATKDGESASKVADGYLKKGTEQFLATVRPPS